MNKNILIAGGVFLGAIVIGTGVYAYKSHHAMYKSSYSDKMPIESSIALSEQEKQDLIFLREEEKLAHDVYAALEKKWGTNVFANIQGSESQHTSKVLEILTAYGMADPVGTNVEGVFTNTTLQALYTDLVSKGSTSLADALKVGAYIEEYDIADIELKKKNTTHPTLLMLYSQLMKGSENHLRAFTKNLAQQNITYVPTILSPQRYNEIITAPQSSEGRGGKGGDKGGKGQKGKPHQDME